MKNPMFIIALILTMLPSHIKSQCSFDPTITPDNVILCPGEMIKLTTQVYDSYQWLRNGDTIPGATSQVLEVDDFSFGGSTISVIATQMGCSENSPGVFIDGWLFLFPYVINGGTYTYNGEAFEVCLNDTITFELGLPYNTGIQWYADGIPIGGENNALIEITSSVTTGVVNYGVCGSPQVCPGYVQCLGVPLNVQFVDCTTGTKEPSISYRIYPNPADNFIHIECNGQTAGSTYDIVDQAGRVLLSGTIISGITEIDVHSLQAGIYFLNLREWADSAHKLIIR